MSLKRIGHFALALAFATLSGPGLTEPASAGSSPAQHDATHPRVMQSAAQEVASAKVGPLQPFTAPPKLAAVGGPGGPTREVFGFGLASSLSDPTVGYPSWNFSMLSTVAFFGLHVQDDGTFAADSGASVWNSSELTGLLTTAHAHGTKVVLTIIQQDFSSGTPHMCSALIHANTTLANTVKEVTAKGVDGVNVDYEGLNGSCGSSDPSAARHAFTSFMAEMHNALPAGMDLSVDTYAGSATDAFGFFDIGAIAPSVSSYFVMAYDLEYSNYAYPPITCGSFCLGPTAPLAGYHYNETSTMSQYTSVVPASKVILGIPYYGRKSCVTTGSPNQYPTSAVVADTYLDASTEYTAPQVQAGSYVGHRDANDLPGQERWDNWFNTSISCNRELYWDDPTALGDKYALINRDNLRGVGIWNLNYGGGAGELWSQLNTYFSCPVALTLPASQGTTQFTVAMSTGTCNSTSFDIQEFDSTFNQGWWNLPSMTASSNGATAIVDGYPGHTYQFQVRAHSAAGYLTAWTPGSTQVAANATKSHPWSGLYELDGYGGVQQADSPRLGVGAYWQGWRIARAAHAQPGPNAPQSGLVLDGWGGLHPFGSGITSIKSPTYWLGWDIARDFAWLPNGTGGYILDGWGGMHPFSVNGAPMPPALFGTPYWPFWDIARKVVIFSDGTGGYVMDGWGGVHAFGIGQPAPPNPIGPYWPGWDIARGIALIPGTHSGYVLDGWGGVSGLTPPGQPVPPGFSHTAYWLGWDIARDIWLLPSSTMAAPAGYVLDGYGGLHGLGNAPPIARGPYWSGWDIAINVTGA
jgi:spore germination protein YaaH